MSNDAVLVVALLGGLVGTILYVTLLVLLGDGVSDEDVTSTRSMPNDFPKPPTQTVVPPTCIKCGKPITAQEKLKEIADRKARDAKMDRFPDPPDLLTTDDE